MIKKIQIKLKLKTIFLAKIFSIIMMIGISLLFAQKIYVFYPTEVVPIVIQKKIMNLLPGIEISAFGLYKDFTTKIKKEPADAIIAKTLLVKQLDGFNIVLKGSYKGDTNDEYILLSVDQKIAIESINQTTVIGIIDFLGRTGMMEFATKLFPTPPKLKRVSKVEDLLSLLTFKLVKGIVIEKKQVKFIEKKSNLNLISTPLPSISSGIIALALKKGTNNPELIKKIKNVKLTLLGVDEWK